MNKLHGLTICCVVCITVIRPIYGAGMILRTLPDKHQVHLAGGRVLKGTIIFSGRRGLVIALENSDLFVPQNRILKTITISQQLPAGKDINNIESTPTDTLKTYHVIKKNGTFALGNASNEPEAKQPILEIPPRADGKNTSNKAPPKANHKQRTDKKILSKARKALAKGKALIKNSWVAKTDAEANILRKKALPFFVLSEALFKQALRASSGNKQIEQDLQEAIKERYWCNKMLHASPGRSKPAVPKRDK